LWAVLHDRARECYRTAPGGDPGNGPGTPGMPFHDRGIQFVAADRIEYRALAGIEARRLLQHDDCRRHRIERTSALRKDRVACIERTVEIRMVSAHVGGTE